jgi:hypothetical protein
LPCIAPIISASPGGIPCGVWLGAPGMEEAPDPIMLCNIAIIGSWEGSIARPAPGSGVAVSLYAKGDGCRGCGTREYCCVDISTSSGSGVAVPAAWEGEDTASAGEGLDVVLAAEDQHMSVIEVTAVNGGERYLPGTSFWTSRCEGPP